MYKFILITLFLFYQGAYADSFNWNSDNLTIQTGNISSLKSLSEMKYKLAYESSGFGHLRVGVKITWIKNKGIGLSQTVFDGMVNNPPKRVATNNEDSTIVIQFEKPCEPEPEDIPQPDLIYKFNLEKGIFEKVSP